MRLIKVLMSSSLILSFSISNFFTWKKTNSEVDEKKRNQEAEEKKMMLEEMEKFYKRKEQEKANLKVNEQEKSNLKVNEQEKAKLKVDEQEMTSSEVDEQIRILEERKKLYRKEEQELAEKAASLKLSIKAREDKKRDIEKDWEMQEKRDIWTRKNGGYRLRS